jgi:hypothetical protein
MFEFLNMNMLAMSETAFVGTLRVAGLMRPSGAENLFIGREKWTRA